MEFLSLSHELFLLFLLSIVLQILLSLLALPIVKTGHQQPRPHCINVKINLY